MTSSFAREIHAFLAEFYISGIHNLRDDVRSFPEVVCDQIRLTVFHFIDTEFLGSGGLDTSEFVVVIDRLNVEWSLIGFVGIIKLQLQWIRAFVLVDRLFNMRLES